MTFADIFVLCTLVFVSVCIFVLASQNTKFGVFLVSVVNAGVWFGIYWGTVRL